MLWESVLSLLGLERENSRSIVSIAERINILNWRYGIALKMSELVKGGSCELFFYGRKGQWDSSYITHFG